MSGETLALAFALVLILEGLLPFVAPAAWRETTRRMGELADGQLRFVGAASILGGVLILMWLK